MRGWANGWCVVAQTAILNLYLQKVGGQEAELETPSALAEAIYDALPEGVVLPTDKNTFCWWIKSYAGRLYSQTKSNVFGEGLNKLVKGIWSIPNPPEQEEGEGEEDEGEEDGSWGEYMTTLTSYLGITDPTTFAVTEHGDNGDGGNALPTTFAWNLHTQMQYSMGSDQGRPTALKYFSNAKWLKFEKAFMAQYCLSEWTLGLLAFVLYRVRVLQVLVACCLCSCLC